jgi:hypothetical protein
MLAMILSGDRHRRAAHVAAQPLECVALRRKTPARFLAAPELCYERCNSAVIIKERR